MIDPPLIVGASVDSIVGETCDISDIPTLSAWSLVILSGFLLTTGTIVLKARTKRMVS